MYIPSNPEQEGLRFSVWLGYLGLWIKGELVGFGVEGEGWGGFVGALPILSSRCSTVFISPPYLPSPLLHCDYPSPLLIFPSPLLHCDNLSPLSTPDLPLPAAPL